MDLDQLTHSVELLCREIKERKRESQSYVMDVLIEGERAHLVELNPWGERGSTDSILFNWVKDKAILEDGLSITFRYRQTNFGHL